MLAFLLENTHRTIYRPNKNNTTVSALLLRPPISKYFTIFLLHLTAHTVSQSCTSAPLLHFLYFLFTFVITPHKLYVTHWWQWRVAANGYIMLLLPEPVWNTSPHDRATQLRQYYWHLFLLTAWVLWMTNWHHCINYPFVLLIQWLKVNLYNITQTVIYGNQTHATQDKTTKILISIVCRHFREMQFPPLSR